jgi:hypothetical protein
VEILEWLAQWGGEIFLTLVGGAIIAYFKSERTKLK